MELLTRTLTATTEETETLNYLVVSLDGRHEGGEESREHEGSIDSRQTLTAVQEPQARKDRKCEASCWD
jgi:hypothetical protein